MGEDAQSSKTTGKAGETTTQNQSGNFSDYFGVPVMILCAFWGLFYFIIFFMGTKQDISPFHEIRWRPKEITDQLLTFANNEIREIKIVPPKDSSRIRSAFLPSKDSTERARKPDSAGNELILQKYRETLYDTIKKFRISINKMTDSAIENSYLKNEIAIETSDLYSLTFKGKDDYSPGGSKFLPSKEFSPDSVKFEPDSVKVTWTNDIFPGNKISCKIRLRYYNFKNSYNAFIDRYPTFAIWFVLLGIQVSFFFFVMPWILRNVFFNPLSQPVPGYKKYYTRIYFLVVAIPISLAYYFLIYGANSKSDLIFPAYFMAHLWSMFGAINIPGYLVAIICFTGCLKCGALALSVSKNRQIYPDAINTIDKLRKEFRNYFGVVAILLSLSTLAPGAFFSSLNSLDFVRQITRSQGYTPLRYDFIYVYGLFHTFLLLLFYLPVNFIFKSVISSIPKAEGNNETGKDDDSKKIRNTAGAFLKVIVEIAVAGSPLLVSLLQNLVTYLNK